MHNDVTAQIFLADARGHTESDGFRSYSSFPFGAYRDENKPPFGPLFVLNDDTLAGGRSFVIEAEEEADVLILPIVGAVDLQGNGNALVEAGQLRCLSVGAGGRIEFGNPYEADLINFLQLWIRRDKGSASSFHTAFSLDQQKNQWVPLGGNNGCYRLFLAKMDGRHELAFRPAEGAGLYLFVIEGVFEVQNRLLETRDGLSLRNVGLLEAEALSSNAILLLLEIYLA